VRRLLGQARAVALLAMLVPAALAAEAATATPMQTPAGETASLRDWAGHIRLVNFWATWCAPCRVEMPLFQAAYERLRGSGFRVIGIALDTAEAVAGFRDRVGITYPLLIAGTDDGMSLMRRYGNTAGAVPFSVLLSADGKVLERHIGPLSEQQLEALLDKHVPGVSDDGRGQRSGDG